MIMFNEPQQGPVNPNASEDLNSPPVIELQDDPVKGPPGFWVLGLGV